MLAMRGKLYLFGGGAGEDWATTYNDINVYDPETKVFFPILLHQRAKNQIAF